MAVINLRDLYRDPTLGSHPDSNASVWIQYTPPQGFLFVYHKVSKRRRRRLRGKFKAFFNKA